MFVELAGKKAILVIGILAQIGVYIFLKKVWGYYLMQTIGAMLLQFMATILMVAVQSAGWD